MSTFIFQVMNRFHDRGHPHICPCHLLTPCCFSYTNHEYNALSLSLSGDCLYPKNRSSTSWLTPSPIVFADLRSVTDYLDAKNWNWQMTSDPGIFRCKKVVKKKRTTRGQQLWIIAKSLSEMATPYPITLIKATDQKCSMT